MPLVRKSRKQRLVREIEHGRLIAARAERIWNWSSPAGRWRAARRGELLVTGARLAPGRHALEIGCGTGLFLERAARSGANLTALDISRDLLERTQQRLGGNDRVSLVCSSAEATPFPDASFDAVYGSSVLHHLDLEAALAEFLRLLKPGGRIAFAEPNIINPQVAVMFLLGPRRLFGVSPDEMAFSRFKIAGTLRHMGYRDVAITPFDFVHPSIPSLLVRTVARVGDVLERLVGLREIAGSLLVRARKA